MVSALVMWLFSSTIVTTLGQECHAKLTVKDMKECSHLCEESKNCETVRSPDVVDPKKKQFCDSEHAVCQFTFACEEGYTINRERTACKRKNPCKKGSHICDEGNNGGCHIKRTCNDNSGDIVCGPCPAGFVNDGDKGCKEIEATLGMVCNDEMGEVWLREPKTPDFEACKKSCLDTDDCNSVTYYPHGGCSHWRSMCKQLKPREGVKSANVRGEALNKRECAVQKGEKWLSKFQANSYEKCKQTCIDDGKCNAFTYYNHGSCSFFTSCCEQTWVTDNAHTERWRLPEYY